MRVMFVCTGNSCRSQMAEGFARALAGPQWQVWSAGLEPSVVNPRAIQAMAEAGVDISAQTSKAIDPELIKTMDLVVTLCGDARDRCPVTPPSVQKLHWPLRDPAQATGTDEEVMAVFRQVRDEIRAHVEQLVRDYAPKPAGPRPEQ